MGFPEVSPKLVAIILVILIVLAIVYYKSSKSEKLTKKKKIIKKPKKAKKTKKVEEPADPEDPEEPEEDEDQAQELYNAVHENMVNGMSADEFKKVAPDHGATTYFNLKQLYNNATSENKDPMNVVTVEQYRQVLAS